MSMTLHADEYGAHRHRSKLQSNYSGNCLVRLLIYKGHYTVVYTEDVGPSYKLLGPIVNAAACLACMPLSTQSQEPRWAR